MYEDTERTAFSIINNYVRFVDRDDTKPKSKWKLDSDWERFIGDKRDKLKLTTRPGPFTLERAINWLGRQVAPTLKMVTELDKKNHTTILKDMIDNAKLQDKHKHLLELENTKIEDVKDTVNSNENDGIF